MSVTKVHYDLELESFRALWSTLNTLRLSIRSMVGTETLQIATPEGPVEDWKLSSVNGFTKDFFAAHNKAVIAIYDNAPFYPEFVKHTAQKVFAIDMEIMKRLGDIDETLMSALWFSELRVLSNKLDDQIKQVEIAIRERLESLRVQS